MDTSTYEYRLHLFRVRTVKLLSLGFDKDTIKVIMSNSDAAIDQLLIRLKVWGVRNISAYHKPHQGVKERRRRVLKKFKHRYMEGLTQDERNLIVALGIKINDDGLIGL